MNVVVRDKQGESHPVRLTHWWPGRWWKRWDITFGAPAPIPNYLVAQAAREGSRYMTVARVDLGYVELTTTARCCPRDQPRRSAGRFIALLRLARALKTMGLKMEKEEKDDGE